MTNGVDLNLLIQQLPHLSKVATAVHTHPEVQKQAIFEQALEKQQQIKDQVQEALKKQPSKGVERDGGGGQSAAWFGQEHPAEEQKQEESPASNASPWMGNLVNIKV